MEQTVESAMTYDISDLNAKQKEVFEGVVIRRKNVFLTGQAGSGKTWVIKKIYKAMASEYNVGLTSLTGISAMILGGCTIHSYLGIKLGLDSFDKLFKKLSYSRFHLNRWRRLELLIIDELSMMNIELFEKLEKLARALRKNDRPFGGIQLLLSADWLQLPAVLSDKFCFESPIWNICIDRTIMLTEVIRQKDLVFSRVLNKIRKGEIDQECKEVIGAREVKYYPGVTGLIPTMLYATNAKVDATNKKYYDALQGEEYTYQMEYFWKQNVYDKERYENMTKLPHEISLKVGAQVMHLVNDTEGELVNGSRGVIKSFIEGYPLVLFTGGITRIVTPCCLDIEENDATVMSYAQIPLKLAWSISVHKSQGSTLDLVRVDLKNIFEYGQFYVALSRCTSLDSLYIRNLNWLKLRINPKALEFYRKLEKNSE
jgi:ATP-dependent DNA helicase PIF1